MKRAQRKAASCITISILSVLALLGLGSCRVSRTDPGIACVKIDPGKDKPGEAYLISLSGPVFMMDIATREETTWISLPEGTWTIDVRVLDDEGKTLASGTARSVKVATGTASPAEIVLSPAGEAQDAIASITATAMLR